MDVIENILTNKYVVALWWLLIVIILGVVATRASRAIRDLSIKYVGLTHEEPKRATTLIQSLAWVFVVILWVVVITTILSHAGVPAALIAGIGTILGAAIGFGSQETVRDVVKGAVHLLEKNINVGDTVSLMVSGEEYVGDVKDITLRTIVLSTVDEGDISVPQGYISVIKNYSNDYSVFKVNIPLLTSSDIDTAFNVLKCQLEDHITHWISSAEEDIAENIVDIEVRGLGAIEEDMVPVEIVGTVVPGEQFAASRMIRKSALSILYDNGITPWSRVIDSFEDDGVEMTGKGV